MLHKHFVSDVFSSSLRSTQSSWSFGSVQFQCFFRQFFHRLFPLLRFVTPKPPWLIYTNTRYLSHNEIRFNTFNYSVKWKNPPEFVDSVLVAVRWKMHDARCAVFHVRCWSESLSLSLCMCVFFSLNNEKRTSENQHRQRKRKIEYRHRDAALLHCEKAFNLPLDERTASHTSERKKFHKMHVSVRVRGI